MSSVWLEEREAEGEGLVGAFIVQATWCCLKVSFRKWDTSMANIESPESKRPRVRAKKLIGGRQWHPKNIQQKERQMSQTHSKVTDLNPAPRRKAFSVRHLGWPLQFGNLHGNCIAPKRRKADIVKPGKKEHTAAICYLQESNFKCKVMCNYELKIPVSLRLWFKKKKKKRCCNGHSNTRIVDTRHILVKKRVR